MFKNMLLVRQV